MHRSLALRFFAILDLLRRYAAVLRGAWWERKRFDPHPHLPHEAAFLPAALDLQETPVSPAPRIAMWLLMAFALIALLWAVFGRIDVVAVAHGRIVPSDRTKVVQPFETAMVKAIRVSDGQAVRAGEVLIELDSTTAEADSARIGNDLVVARMQAGQARAFLVAMDSGKVPAIGIVPGTSADRIFQEQRVLDGQFGEYRARLARIDAEIAKRERRGGRSNF